MTKATGCEVLLQVVYYEVTSLCIRQANQVGYDNGGWTINYILQLKSMVLTRDLEERKMKIVQIYASILLYFLFNVAAFDVSSQLLKWQ